MARTADTDLPRRRKEMGKRLREVIKKSSYKMPKPFLDALKERNGMECKTSEGGYYLEGLDSLGTLSRIMAGKLTLKNKHATMAADMLGIDVNYLLGTIDDFEAGSYEEYLKLAKEYKKAQVEFNKFFLVTAVLQPMGYSIDNFSKLGDNNDTYAVSHGGITATIPAARMDQLIEDMKLLADNRMKSLMTVYGSEEV